MQELEKLLIFLCPRGAKADRGRLSYQIANRLETLGIAHVGTLKNLSQQHSSSSDHQRRMIFINDCQAECVKVLTNGFDADKYISFNVYPFLTQADFQIEPYINSEILPLLNDKWGYSFSLMSSTSKTH